MRKTVNCQDDSLQPLGAGLVNIVYISAWQREDGCQYDYYLCTSSLVIHNAWLHAASYGYHHNSPELLASHPLP